MLDIKKEREKLDMTQKELADLLGVTRKTIVNYEGGSNIPESKEKIFKRLLNNHYAQKKASYNIDNATHRFNEPKKHRKLEQKEIDFITWGFENNFDQLMTHKPFKKEFLYRNSEYSDSLTPKKSKQ
ncbi:helix-turn-helix transcriptional regulator [Flavivirga jejuensis]|uniref:Helix-turn-helix domain-containing protein n=1 Tax=Flavivirga jejuensis TaxID=870487 RepID=A0ABT8WQ16_9FLAO|nr:helix-turn-helix domain-containing protein [Flavivirga jejuensis]MDO5975262.1 helix-turn-helix domain-containing protein [Flavivirga jejuensis]